MNRYFLYLIDLIDGREYSNLLEKLHSVEYNAYIKGDDNRTSFGKKLRDEFDGVYDGPFGGATILEVLVGLSIECENKLMYDEEKGDRTSSWFWMMLHNAGITYWSDENSHRPDFEEATEEWIYIFNNRKYKRDGTGGNIFILKKPQKDMRKVELWYQLNWYMVENFKYELL